MPDTLDAATPAPNDVVERVLDVVRQLARETGGARAERAVSATASLEREIGLGSLERVELVARLERAFARPLDDGCLAVDTAAGLARAILEAAPGEPLRLPAREQALGAASAIGTGVRDAVRLALAARRARSPARARVPARRGQGRGRASDLVRQVARRGGGRRGGPARARHRARRHGRAHAPHRARFPALLLRHPAAARRAGADLPSAPPRPARGVREPPVRDPQGRRRRPARDDRARPARGEPAQAVACRRCGTS